MKKVLVLLALFVATTSFAFTLSWDPVTTYTDNTAIGLEINGVFYNIEMDGTQVVTKTPATSWIIPPVAKKSAHTFRAQAELGTGEVSVWSPPFAWTAPAGNPRAPGQLRVNP